MPGYHTTNLHPQNLQPSTLQPTNKTNHENAAQEKKVGKNTTTEWSNNNSRSLFSPDNSQSTFNLHQKILSRLHRQQSREHHHQQTESSFLWSANKSLLHAIRLQVINGKKIKKPRSLFIVFNNKIDGIIVRPDVFVNQFWKIC